MLYMEYGHSSLGPRDVSSAFLNINNFALSLLAL